MCSLTLVLGPPLHSSLLPFFSLCTKSAETPFPWQWACSSVPSSFPKFLLHMSNMAKPHFHTKTFDTQTYIPNNTLPFHWTIIFSPSPTLTFTSFSGPQIHWKNCSKTSTLGQLLALTIDLNFPSSLNTLTFLHSHSRFSSLANAGKVSH